jgi:hypothetical protein
MGRMGNVLKSSLSILRDSGLPASQQVNIQTKPRVWCFCSWPLGCAKRHIGWYLSQYLVDGHQSLHNRGLSWFIYIPMSRIPITGRTTINHIPCFDPSTCGIVELSKPRRCVCRASRHREETQGSLAPVCSTMACWKIAQLSLLIFPIQIHLVRRFPSHVSVPTG